jgi:nucleoid DNA-binding protein
MVDRMQKKDVVQRLARRMGTDERTAEAWLGALTETLYEAFKEGRSVTLPDFGGFYVRPHREAWAFKFNPGQKLRPLFRWSSSYKGKL